MKCTILVKSNSIIPSLFKFNLLNNLHAAKVFHFIHKYIIISPEVHLTPISFWLNYTPDLQYDVWRIDNFHFISDEFHTGLSRVKKWVSISKLKKAVFTQEAEVLNWSFSYLIENWFMLCFFLRFIAILTCQDVNSLLAWISKVLGSN